MKTPHPTSGCIHVRAALPVAHGRMKSSSSQRLMFLQNLRVRAKASSMKRINCV
jgi:hypothetical protein